MSLDGKSATSVSEFGTLSFSYLVCCFRLFSRVQKSRTLEATITRSFFKEKKGELLLNVHHLSSLKCGSRLWSCFIFLPAKWFELLTALKKNHYMVNSTTVHYFVRDAIFFLQQNVSHRRHREEWKEWSGGERRAEEEKNISG